MVSDGAGAGMERKKKNIRHRDSVEPRKFPKSQVKNTKGRDDPLPRIEQSEEGPSQDQGWMGLVVGGRRREEERWGWIFFFFFFPSAKPPGLTRGVKIVALTTLGNPARSNPFRRGGKYNRSLCGIGGKWDRSLF